MSAFNRFIILRGPSGAGKSTVAGDLLSLATKRTVLIQQDHYRFIFKPSGGGSATNADTIHLMIEHNCTVALQAGYEVILEGILSVKSYSPLLDRIIEAHDGPSHMFYFDVSFDETTKRHQTRQATVNFTADDMRNWYESAHRSNHHLERLIPESFSNAQTVEFIHKAIGMDSGQS